MTPSYLFRILRKNSVRQLTDYSQSMIVILAIGSYLFSKIQL